MPAIARQEIVINRMITKASIGVHPHEHSARQRISLDLHITIASNKVAHNDEIDSVLDYDQVYIGISQLITTRHYRLQETLAAAIAEFCFSFSHVTEVKLNLGKLDVFPDCAAVGISQHWTR